MTHQQFPAPSTRQPVNTSRTPLNPRWRGEALCKGKPVDLFFPTSSSEDEAEIIGLCKVCPVRTECLAHALDEHLNHGVFGGTSGKWRKNLLDRRPNVPSWNRLLAQAKAHYHRFGTYSRPPLPGAAAAAGTDRHAGPAPGRAATQK
ncbi:WhiB family transcriptional regulator [Streptomyces chartreusis]|uniref:WhiB family transcriptional regulator n=1 Tax=Streptomyces chartreusis TaxID=1969 RepID=UPI002E17E35E